MNFVWNVDGVAVGSVSMNRWEGMQMFTTGFGLRHGRLFQWEATVTPQGWNVSITASTGRIGEWQGPTFNLPLEIAAAANRLM